MLHRFLIVTINVFVPATLPVIYPACKMQICASDSLCSTFIFLCYQSAKSCDQTHYLVISNYMIMKWCFQDNRGERKFTQRRRAALLDCLPTVCLISSVILKAANTLQINILTFNCDTITGPSHNPLIIKSWSKSLVKLERTGIIFWHHEMFSFSCCHSFHAASQWAAPGKRWQTMWRQRGTQLLDSSPTPSISSSLEQSTPMASVTPALSLSLSGHSVSYISKDNPAFVLHESFCAIFISVSIYKEMNQRYWMYCWGKDNVLHGLEKLALHM